MYKESDYLEHFGIPGMRWGRRKSGSISNTTSKSHKNPKIEKDISSVLNKHKKNVSNALNKSKVMNKKMTDIEKSDLAQKRSHAIMTTLLAGVVLSPIAGLITWNYHRSQGDFRKPN